MKVAGDELDNRYRQAADALVERVKSDPHLLAAILFGSLSHDRVWERSDIDVMLVCGEVAIAGAGKKPSATFALTESGINIHAMIWTRSEFKRLAERTVSSDFLHACFSTSRLLFCRDSSLERLYNEIQVLGERDKRAQQFQAASWATLLLTKADKWLTLRKDPHYAALWLFETLTPLARIEVLSHGKIPGREVLQQAVALNPDFFAKHYLNLMDAKKTEPLLRRSIDAADRYLCERVPALFAPLLEFLEAAGTLRSATEIDDWCRSHHQIDQAVAACEYLADKGFLHKGSAPRRLTAKSPIAFEELAFYFNP